jgi:hypothetical protein
MPEWGMLPIPTKLVKQGVRDMLRLSDARMSGTSYGACVLHCAPEAYIGGPLALVRTGDLITVDVPARRIHLEVSRRTGAPPRRLDTAAQALRARLRLDVRQAHPAGRRGLRLRLPRNLFGAAGARARYLLSDLTAMNPQTREQLMTVSTATLCTALFKRGLRNQFIQDVRPLNPACPTWWARPSRCATSRARRPEPDHVFQDRGHPQRVAVEQCPPGAVLVIDSRKDARAASAGGHPGQPADETRRRRRRSPTAAFATARDRASCRFPGLPPAPQRADQPDAAPGAGHQRAHRLRRRGRVAGRRDGGRRRRRGRDPRPPGRRSGRRGGGDDRV